MVPEMERAGERGIEATSMSGWDIISGLQSRSRRSDRRSPSDDSEPPSDNEQEFQQG